MLKRDRDKLNMRRRGTFKHVKVISEAGKIFDPERNRFVETGSVIRVPWNDFWMRRLRTRSIEIVSGENVQARSIDESSEQTELFETKGGE